MPAVTKAHPHIYATKADFDRLGQIAGTGPSSFPSKGRLTFQLHAVPKGASDVDKVRIFGRNSDEGSQANSIRLSYLDGANGPSVEAVLFDAAGKATYLAGQPLKIDGPNSISVTYEAGRWVKFDVNGAVQSRELDWSMAGQQFIFQGHNRDRFTNVGVFDTTNPESPVWSSPEVEVAANSAWRAYLNAALKRASVLKQCGASTDALCDPSKGGRKEITEVARQLALAYRFTRNGDILAGVTGHIERLKAVPLTAGGEWSMSGRVGAMALYYDWLYEHLAPGDLAALAQHIKDTIKADKAWVPGDKTINGNDDLIYSVCGQQALQSTVLDCAAAPVFKAWQRYPKPAPASTSDTYISGHPASAATLVASALLAIVEDGHEDVRPMIQTIYEHYRQGYLPARDLYSVDGGNHMAFSYGGASGGDMADRLIMWDRALGGASGLALKPLGKLIYPYIYGLRSDGKFPARGDNFAFNSTAEMIASMALAAARPTTAPDSTTGTARAADNVAATFYRDAVLGAGAGGNQSLIWQRLLYGKPGTISTSASPPLSRYFSKAGQVLIRNTWDNAQNTLLEFKSTSFISENHQHLDQNSFSLYYKAPLLVDSGLYDGYLTTHWKNYYQRTIAHNAIVVFDKDQRYLYSGENKEWSNDGGQWYGTRPIYPTIEEALKPGGSNLLDGVTAYEGGGNFVYVAGNASKAYSGMKDNAYLVEQNAGMQRSIVYLRQPNLPDPPVILVFDNVLAKVKATSLLHMAVEPIANDSYERIAGEPGRRQFAKDASLFTVRNGGGMVTIQTLLPKGSRSVVLSGGKGGDEKCEQFSADSTAISAPDCRFLVHSPDGSKWVNYPPAVGSSGGDVDLLDENAPDVGGWRLEISDDAVANATPDSAGYKRQYFLNALHVVDNDEGTRFANPAKPAVLLPTEGTAIAVQVADRVVVFNGGSVAATTVKWQPGSLVGTNIVVGLQRNTCYVLDKSNPMWTLKVAAGSCATPSSNNGVLTVQ